MFKGLGMANDPVGGEVPEHTRIVCTAHLLEVGCA